MVNDCGQTAFNLCLKPRREKVPTDENQSPCTLAILPYHFTEVFRGSSEVVVRPLGGWLLASESRYIETSPHTPSFPAKA